MVTATEKAIAFCDADPCRWGLERIQHFAEVISKEFHLTEFSDDVDPLQQFIKGIGGRIHYQDAADFVASESGSIEVLGRNDFDIYLSAFTGPLRDRFTLAHELGHYFLHSDQGNKPIKASRKGVGQLEAEANYFAGALLMPRDVFAQVALESKKNLNVLAGRFQVSTRAVEVRLSILSI